MPDDLNTPDPNETPNTEAESTETPPEGAPSGETPPAGGEPKLSHDDALKEVERVRREAAGYRTRLRETEELLAKAKTPEEFEAAVSELKARNAELEHSIVVNTVAAKYKLPAELREVLTGATEAELEAHAQKLAKFVPVDEEPPPAELRGGLDPSGTDPDLGLSPRELARKHTRRR